MHTNTKSGVIRSGHFTGQTLKWIFLLVIAFFTLFPIVMAILGSFKTNAELTTGATLLPSVWKFSNYATAWKQANFARFTWNSLFISTIVTIGTLLIASMSAYAVDRTRFPGKRLYVILQASTMFISIGAVVLRPQFDLMVKLGLNKSLWGVIIILISAHATVYFMLIGFFKAIPKDLDEAAYIDGCNFYTVYWRIILPLLSPRSWRYCLVHVPRRMERIHLAPGVHHDEPETANADGGAGNLRYGIGAAAESHLMMAGACLSFLPILVVYVLANKSFIQVTAGSVKG